MRRTLAFLGFLGLLASCSGDDDSTGSTAASGGAAQSCTPGKVVACACPGSAVSGTQTCLPGGTFGACAGCPSGSAGTGGSSGNSGQSGAAGVSGGGASGAGAGGAGEGGSGGAGQGGAAGGAGGSGGSGQSGAGAGGAGAGGAGQGGSLAGSGGQSGGGGGVDPCGGCDAAKGEACVGGKCLAGCALAEAQGASAGCEFWAVDLDNEPDSGVGTNAAAQPWGLVIGNLGAKPAEVTIELNEAPQGQPPQITPIKTATIAPGDFLAQPMDSREVDGGKSPGDPDAPGTFLSSGAFRITSSEPVSVYQFNSATNSFSNDASLLLPRHALGVSYRVLGWRPANPVPPPVVIPGVPDHAYVTVVGVEAGTTVKVKPTWKIKAGGPVPAVAAGGEYSVKLGPFDVLNLETADSASSDGVKGGELSGTLVDADKPVVVFFGTERALVPMDVDVPKPPGWQTGEICCTAHLEEQIPPKKSVGKRYVVARSPVRSVGGFHEPDVLRLVGGDEVATVKTSLPGAFASFTLQPGEVKDLWTDTDTTIDASAPVQVGQLLVSGQLCQGAPLGDPALVILPAVDQFLSEYAIPFPISWTTRHLALVVEAGTDLKIDGAAPAGCEVHDAGSVGGVSYQAWRCPVADGMRRVSASKPVGVVAFGYGQASAYALVGGARYGAP